VILRPSFKRIRIACSVFPELAPCCALTTGKMEATSDDGNLARAAKAEDTGARRDFPAANGDSGASEHYVKRANDKKQAAESKRDEEKKNGAFFWYMR